MLRLFAEQLDFFHIGSNDSGDGLRICCLPGGKVQTALGDMLADFQKHEGDSSVPASSPRRSLPCSEQPLMYIVKAGCAVPLMTLTVPRKPSSPIWWVPQLEGQPEI